MIRPAARTPWRRRLQAGMTLIIAMVMLVIIGFTSVAVMRGALDTDQVALGLRSQAQALQYAQAALRWCESRAWSQAPTPGVLDAASPPHWTLFGTWHGGPAYTLTRGDLAATSPGAAFPAQAPQCLSEARVLADGGTLVVTTARGLSADFSSDPAGRTRSGAVAWVQSIATPRGEQRVWRQLLAPPAP
jgi:Tfp pilus assembly protein PilV